MRSLLPAIALCSLAALLSACGAQSDAGFASDTDDLSPSTYSMEMVRQDPSLAPDVVVPPGRHVNGHARPLADGSDGVSPNLIMPIIEGSDFLYTSSQLGQFLNLADPAVYPSDKSATVYSRQPGDLFATDDTKLVWDRIEQGALGDCYFAASFVAVIFADQGGTLTKNLIVPNKANGKVVSYYVTFFQASGRKVRIEVDPDLLHAKTAGEVYYMASTETKDGYEEWAPSLVEKAYAAWHKTYKAIGDGGTAADAIFALTGKKTKAGKAGDADIATRIEIAGKSGKAQVACTWGDQDGVSYKDTGIYSDHCYTLRGIRRSGSNVFVQLRNPWGPTADGASEPTEPPTDGVQDGIFELPLATFQTLYDDVSILP